MHSELTYRIMALAAITQAAELVKLIARKATTSDELLRVMFNSITLVDVENPLQVYGSLDKLELGYQILNKQMDDHVNREVEVSQYMMGMMGLERKLTRNKATLEQLSGRINQLNRQLNHFDILDDSVIANIASIYTDVISPLSRRIQVSGAQKNLQIQSNQNKIRALLLSGLRAAVLWRQLGGKRRQLVLSKQMIMTEVRKALAAQ